LSRKKNCSVPNLTGNAEDCDSVKWYWPELTDLKESEKAAHEGAGVCFLVAGGTAIVAGISVWLDKPVLEAALFATSSPALPLLSVRRTLPDMDVAWGISWLFGGDTWIWKNVSLLQWCDPVVKPSLSFYNGNTWISYVFKGAKPTAMPGQYINGDVPGIASIDGVMVYPDLGPTGTIGTTNGGIYTWNSTDTDYRGPAGQPYQTCQGQ
jgi:hypothetical protein